MKELLRMIELLAYPVKAFRSFRTQLSIITDLKQ